MIEGYSWQVSETIGEKVLEMADRLASVDKIVPGTRANCGIEIDGVAYDLMLTVTPPAPTLLSVKEMK